MRRPKAEPLLSLRGQRCLQLLLTLALIYASLLFVCEFPFVSRRPAAPQLHHHGLPLDSEAESTLARPSRLFHPSPTVVPHRRSLVVSGLSLRQLGSGSASSDLHESASHAWDVGRKLFDELESSPASALAPSGTNGTEERCPHSITLSGAQLEERGGLLLLPCGLTLGSHITLVGRPRRAHAERDPTIAATRGGGGTVMVSQFMVELQGLRSVEGEDPPRILYFNPRLKGDWSGRPVIEHNNCYRMQWGPALRCDGWGSRPDEERVDGLVKCEKWNRDENKQLEDSKTTWWLNHLIDKENKVPFDWSFPFVEDKLFVLTLSAGFEGCHVSVDGRHVTSFPYRTGFDLEDATGLSLNGDLNIHSIIAASLPTSHPSFAPQRYLEMSSKWQTSPLPAGPIDLFIGILSAGNHFGERMAARKSWMSAIRHSPNVVALFFVAMHRRKEVNVELKKEAEFFGDIVIVPFLESYDLVVLKTVAICEYGLHTVSSKYIMKCDDDTFVRVDSVMKEVENVPVDRSFYMGNINYHHKPLRSGKWAVTYEEWHEEDYPPYANGAGYVVSSDIAWFIVSKFEKHTLRLFKMEDVSMGIWVEQFNKSRPVEYIHSLKFCQFGCIDDYLTAHYQSPREMICMWEKMQMGRPECCNLG